MHIKLRDKNNDLIIKDILDVELDMRAEKDKDRYNVRVNRDYYLDGDFSSKEKAEESMRNIADLRDKMEEEIRSWVGET